MVFSNQELKNMAYRSANLGMLPSEDFILDEKKIINGYKTKKYGLNERIGELGESLSDHIRKMEIVKGQLSKEVVALNKSNTAAIEQEIHQQEGKHRLVTDWQSLGNRDQIRSLHDSVESQKLSIQQEQSHLCETEG